MNSTHRTKITDEAVLNASGKTWSQWFSELENKGFLDLGHREITKRLNHEYEVPLWWAQTIAYAFERKHELNETHVTKADFEVSVSKTFHYPVTAVAGLAREWFEHENRVELRSNNNDKHLRCNWLTDDSRIHVHFNAKGEKKTQMIVQHEKLSNQSDVDVMRNYWKERLDQMVESL